MEGSSKISEDPLGCTVKKALSGMVQNPINDIKALWIAMTKKPIIMIAGEEVDLSADLSADLSGVERFGRVSLKTHYLPNTDLTDKMISYFNDFPAILENATHDHKKDLEIFLEGLKYRYKTIATELSQNIREQGDTRKVRRKTKQEQDLSDLIKKVGTIIKDLDSPAKKTAEAMRKIKENELQSLIRKFAMLVLRTNPSPSQQKFITTLREMEEGSVVGASDLERQIVALASGDIYKDLLNGVLPSKLEGLTADTTKGKIIEIIEKRSNLQAQVKVLEAELIKHAKEAEVTQAKLVAAEDAKRTVGSAEDQLVKDIALKRAKEEALAAEELAARTQTKLNKVRAELSYLEDDVERKTRELGGARKTIAELKAEIAAKEAAAVAAANKAKANMDELEASRAALATAQGTLAEAEKKGKLEEVKTASIAVQTAEEDVNALEAKAQETEAAAALAAATIADLQKQLDNSRKATENATRLFTGQTAINKIITDKHNAELTEAKAKLAALEQAQPVNNRQEIDGLKAALAEKERETTAAREELDRVKAELDALIKSKTENNQAGIDELRRKIVEKEDIINANNDELAALRSQVAASVTNQAEVAKLTARISALEAEKAAFDAEKTVLQNKGTKFNAITKYAADILDPTQTPAIPTIIADPIKQMLEKLGNKPDNLCVLAYFVNYFYSTLLPPKEMMDEINNNLNILWFGALPTSAMLYQLLTEIEPALLVANKVQYSSAGTYSIQKETSLLKNLLDGARKINSLEAWSIVRKGRGSTANNMMIYPDDKRVLLFYIPNRTPPDTQKILFNYDTSTGIISRTTTYIDDDNFNKKDKGISYDVLFLYFLAATKRYIETVKLPDTCGIPTVDDNACLPIYIDIVDIRGIKLSTDLITIFTAPPYCFRTTGGSYLIKEKLYNDKQFMAAIESVFSNCKKNTKIPIPPGFTMNNGKLIIITDKYKSLEAQLDLSLIRGNSTQFYDCTKKGGSNKPTKKRTKQTKNFTQKKRR